MKILEPHRHDLRPPFYEICAVVSTCREEHLQAFTAGIPNYFRAPKQQAHFRYHLGEIHLRRGDLAAAEEALRQAIALYPPVAVFHHQLSMVLQRQGRIGEAAAASEQAITLDPDNAHLRQRSQALRARIDDATAAAASQPAAPSPPVSDAA